MENGRGGIDNHPAVDQEQIFFRQKNLPTEGQGSSPGLVAIEDSRFYEHGGIDLRGVTRALVKDVIKWKMAEGGSTITQQLIKNKYFSGKQTFQRKVQEGILALEYERKYTKK